MIEAITGILQATSPSIPQLSSFFSKLGGISPDIRTVLLNALDADYMKKMGIWASTLSEHLNNLNIDLDEAELAKIADPTIANDFFSLMGGTGFRGRKLTQGEISAAHNDITKAIKAENWKEAIQFGMSLAGAFPAV